MIKRFGIFFESEAEASYEWRMFTLRAFLALDGLAANTSGERFDRVATWMATESGVPEYEARSALEWVCSIDDMIGRNFL